MWYKHVRVCSWDGHTLNSSSTKLGLSKEAFNCTVVMGLLIIWCQRHWSTENKTALWTYKYIYILWTYAQNVDSVHAAKCSIKTWTTIADTYLRCCLCVTMDIGDTYFRCCVLLWISYMYTSLSSFPGSPLHAHIYCVTFDPHEESQFFMWVKGHAIDVRTWGEPGNEAIYMSMFGINSQLSLSLSLSISEERRGVK